MNNNRRKKLYEAVSMLETAYNIVEHISEEEQNCLDNIPENLVFGEMFEKIENAIEFLDNALENIDAAKENIHDACE